MMEIRQALESDWLEIWPILHEVFVEGDTYPHLPETDESTAREYWIVSPTASYAALMNGRIVGSYFLRPNQPGLGSHVCNAGYIVSSATRLMGIGTAMGKHSLVEAKRLGFKAIQFNLVVSTNKPSVHLWQKLGFKLIGTLSQAFNHCRLGLVDAFVMYRRIDDINLNKTLLKASYFLK